MSSWSDAQEIPLELAKSAKIHFAILGMAPNAAAHEIKKAFRKLSRLRHPDMVTRSFKYDKNSQTSEEEQKQTALQQATENFKALNKAQEFLLNVESNHHISLQKIVDCLNRSNLGAHKEETLDIDDINQDLSLRANAKELKKEADLHLANHDEERARKVYEKVLECLTKILNRSKDDDLMIWNVASTNHRLYLQSQYRSNINCLISKGVKEIIREAHQEAFCFFDRAMSYYDHHLTRKTKDDNCKMATIKNYLVVLSLLNEKKPLSDSHSLDIKNLYYQSQASIYVNKAENQSGSDSNHSSSIKYFKKAINCYSCMANHTQAHYADIMLIFSNIITSSQSFQVNSSTIELVRKTLWKYVSIDKGSIDYTIITQLQLAIADYYYCEGCFKLAANYYQYAVSTDPKLKLHPNYILALENAVTQKRKVFYFLSFNERLEFYDYLIAAYIAQAQALSGSQLQSAQSSSAGSSNSSMFSTTNYQDCIEIDKKLFTVCFSKATIYYEQKQFDKAVENYMQALDMLTYNSRQILTKSKKPEALIIIEQIIKSIGCFLMCDQINHAVRALDLIHSFVLSEAIEHNKPSNSAERNKQYQQLMTLKQNYQKIATYYLEKDQHSEATHYYKMILEVLKAMNALQVKDSVNQEISLIEKQIKKLTAPQSYSLSALLMRAYQKFT